MATWFDEAYYLKAKLAQLKAVGEKDGSGNDYTLTTLKKAIADNGMTPEEHYNAYGRSEGVNPNAYFNEAEYLQAKLEQLHSVNETDAHGNPYTLTTLKEAIANIGLTPAEHYELYGSHETNKDGTLINPSNAFDANAYAAAKLHQLQHGTAEEQAAWADKTPADVMDAIQDAGMSPVTHYMTYGAAEANAGKVPMVQTVPSEQRVANDPHRDDFGQNVPSNYNAPTPAPSEADAAPVTKPADMGGMASTDVSPQVVSPDKPVAVPGDKGYVTPPAGTVDTNDHPVVPVVDPGSGQLVVPTEPTTPPSPPTPPSPTPDTTAPSAPTFDATLAGDNVIDMGEAHNNVLLTGTAEANSTVKITVTETLAQSTLSETLDTVKAGADGKFSITFSPEDITKFNDGSLTLSATATDAAGNISKAATKTITLDKDAAATYSATKVAGITAQFGHTHTEGNVLQDAKLGTLDASKSDGLLNELQKVFDNVTGTGTVQQQSDYESVDALAKDAPNFSKLVRFYANSEKVNEVTRVTGSENNFAMTEAYGGGLSLSLEKLNATQGGSRGAALATILGEARFDLPELDITANNTIFLEVNKVGSSITTDNFPLSSGLLDMDLTFASAVEFASRIKPVAVNAHTGTLDIHLAFEGDADTVNLMEVRGEAETIHFSGTKGHFGINVDTSKVSTIDASSLTDTDSGVYVNTAPIEVSIPLPGANTASLKFHADVADNLTFKGSAGDDLLVMTAEKYAKITSVDGGAGDDDTLVIVNDGEGSINTDIEDNPTEYTVTFKANTSGFENIGLASFAHLPDARFIIKDASTFTGVKQFITTNDLKIANMASGTEISVVSLMDSDVKLDLTAASAGGSVTLNLAMTDNFLMHLDGLLDAQGAQTPHGKATLTNADNISGLTLTGADAAADILLSDEALKDLNGKTIDVAGYAGDIQYASGWAYSDTSLTKTDGGTSYTVTLSGVQAGTAITGEDAS